MREPVYVGKTKDFPGSEEEKQKNRDSHIWVKEEAPSRKVPDSFAQKAGLSGVSVGGYRHRCSECGFLYVSREADWPCGAYETMTDEDVYREIGFTP
jgi:hypothetical protein